MKPQPWHDLTSKGSIFEDRNFCCAVPIMANGGAVHSTDPYEVANPANVISGFNPQGTDILSLAEITKSLNSLKTKLAATKITMQTLPGGVSPLITKEEPITSSKIEESLKKVGFDLGEHKSILIMAGIVAITLYFIL
jgi:hypothetical protein